MRQRRLYLKLLSSITKRNKNRNRFSLSLQISHEHRANKPLNRCVVRLYNSVRCTGNPRFVVKESRDAIGDKIRTVGGYFYNNIVNSLSSAVLNT